MLQSPSILCVSKCINISAFGVSICFNVLHLFGPSCSEAETRFFSFSGVLHHSSCGFRRLESSMLGSLFFWYDGCWLFEVQTWSVPTTWGVRQRLPTHRRNACATWRVGGWWNCDFQICSARVRSKLPERPKHRENEVQVKWKTLIWIDPETFQIYSAKKAHVESSWHTSSSSEVSLQRRL